MAEKREHWSSGWGFLMAAIGSAIGLGNIWKFPYITGMNGGGAFVLVYLVCILTIGLPVMICEISMGRATQLNPLGAFRKLAPKHSLLAHSTGSLTSLTGLALALLGSWGFGGLLIVLGLLIVRYGWVVAGLINGVVCIVLIMGVYCVVGGWTLLYALRAFSNHLAFTDEAGANLVFHYFAHGEGLGLWFSWGGMMLFLLLCALVVAAGVRNGIEKYSKILMPSLFALLLILILRGITLPGAMAGVSFFLTPDFSKLSARGVLEALGHAFYSLSLGMGIMITYGSYMSPKQSVVKNALAVIGFDTLAAMMGGLAIFPTLFALGFRPDSGPGLVFKVLPAAFNHMPGGFGFFWSGIFFLVLSIAALTSGVSLLEVITSVLIDEFKMSRRRAVLWSSLPIAGLGTLCVLSVANWDRLSWFAQALGKVFSKIPPSFFDLLDFVSSSWILPLSGLAISLFVGWIWGTRRALHEIRKSGGDLLDVNLLVLLSGLKDEPGYDNPHKIFTAASCWGIFIRFISPLAIMVMFLHAIGVLQL
ncbi:MAG: sodium-dependent transporter [Victivallaceae bacterium]